MKQLLSLLLCIALLFSFGMFAQAEDTQTLRTAEAAESYHTESAEAAAQAEGEAKTVREHIIAGLERMDSSINVYSYNVRTSEVRSLFQGIVSSNPRLFYANGGFSYSYYTNGRVTSIRPYYTIAKNELPERKQAFEAAVQRALDAIPDGISDVEKVLAANEYIVSTARYSTASSSAYGIFVDGRAQCKGYTKAFRLLMQELGITCIQTGNSAHVWNMVQIDGDWYHVDTTWNDPTPNALGRVRHINLLCSDEVFAKNGHKSWASTSPKADNTQYDNAWWRASWSQIVYHEGLWYYMTGRGYTVRRRIHSYDFATGTSTELYNFSAAWPSSGGNWSHNASLGYYDGTLYYNGAKGIYAIDLESEEPQSAAFIAEPLEGRSRFYEMEVIGNRLRYRIKASPTGSTQKEVTVLLGDVGKTYQATFETGAVTTYVLPVLEGDTVQPPATPARSGYTFLGWQYQEQDFNFGTPITQDMTFTANWKAAEEEVIPEELTAYVGQSLQLQPELEIEDDPAVLLWKSLDEAIATVDEDGTLFAAKAGTVTVLVTNGDGETLASFVVEVLEKTDDDPDDGDEEEPADKTDLNNKIAAAEAIDTSLYTSASAARLQNALEAAKRIQDQEDAAQDDVDSACAVLQQAINALERKQTDPPKECFRLWGITTKYEKTPLNWFLCIVCFGWIWMVF